MKVRSDHRSEFSNLCNWKLDKEKSHLHLLSTHFYIRDYKTNLVNRPRQLVATVCF